MKCVYAIINLVNNKKYVGSTLDFETRKGKHLSLLRYGKHHSLSLQQSFIKHGEENFKFIILDELSESDDQYKSEQYWLDHLKTYNKKYGYNMSIRANGPELAGHKKAVLQYSLTGAFIAEYPSILHAYRELGIIGGGSISKACKGGYRFAHGYIWIYKLEFNEELLAFKIKKANSPVEKSKETRALFSRLKLGTKASKETRVLLSKVHKGKIPKNLAALHLISRRKVFVYSVNKEFIEQFNSVTECQTKYPGCGMQLWGKIKKKPRKFIFSFEKL